MKLRPVLLLTPPVGAIPEVLVAYISSVIPAELFPSDLLIDPGRMEFSSTNLKVVSVLRLHKLATVHASMIVRYLGRLDAQQRIVISRKLREMLQL